MSHHSRPPGCVPPRWVLVAIAVGLALQLLWGAINLWLLY